jgi:SAM-dependent methyltransferase
MKARIGFLLLLAGAVIAVARLRHRDGGREVPGGILMGQVGAYDFHTRWLLGSLFDGIAADVAGAAPRGARVLEVGSGPGHLSIRLAQQHGLDVTGLDLDPAMVEHARANAARADAKPTFVAGDVASLPFPDGSFDLVVSTMSMHHWADPEQGLAEIGRVLRPDGKTLVWDLRQGLLPFVHGMSDPMSQVPGPGLRLVGATPWRWPWRFSLITRIELVRAVPEPVPA